MRDCTPESLAYPTNSLRIEQSIVYDLSWGTRTHISVSRTVKAQEGSELMQFLALTCRRSDNFPLAEFGARAEEEAEQARVLYGQGFIRQIWYRGDVEGACILVEADSEEHVLETLNTLPLFQAGMLEVSIIPLKPYAGFGSRKASSTDGSRARARPSIGPI